ncbi:energy-coupling factor transport system ATP-binding protein [Trichococcus patagoniensis]|uniref:Energy-coupling factor transport system ATP-binding protein n=1 Tax=Trichococcus patagoniensis TaxID=382641 RepID=A0A2T5INU7_9LACT|nr:ABC transporter ATP-binding protein [Trichococcus patagoniensis]PTQ85505.1 energy-coupling factor transport system ATP-binding protein [Trichococcus patagoniensis]
MEQQIYVEKLKLKFPGDAELLFRDLTFSVAPGEKVLLLGPSGCGKSTLLQVLSGLIPQSIEVPVKADKIATPASWGYVFQDPDSQFCMPYVDEELAFVLENLAVPREEMAARIDFALQQVGLELADNHIPIASLSGGMKQRLAIASVLLLDPEVLFLDEPSAMLDPEGTKAIWEVLQQVCRDKTVVIVEHKIDHVLALAERLVLFDASGRIIADGPNEAIFSAYKDEMKEQGIWFPGVWERQLEESPLQRGEAFLERQNPLLELRDFKGFRNGETKIEGTELAACPGEWVIIQGQNGAGKSTFLHAVMQFIKTSGRCELEGKPIKKVKKLAERVAFVFQNPEYQFVANTVYEEMAYSLRLDGKAELEIGRLVEEHLELFQLSGHRDKNPFQLSMGQKRRLSVAATIIQGQRLILLDEPTFGLDSKNTFALLGFLESYRKKGAAILMVTHDEVLARHYGTAFWTVAEGEIRDMTASVADAQAELCADLRLEGGLCG